MEKLFGRPTNHNKIYSPRAGLLCSEASFAETRKVEHQRSLSAGKFPNPASQFKQINFINNMNSTEDWAKSKNLQGNRVLGKRADSDRTKDVLQ